MESTTLSRARLGVPLAACFAAVAALSFGVRNESFVDAALPLYAAALASIAFLEGRRFGDATLAFAIPLLAVWRIGVVDENLRIYLYGITFAVAAVWFAARAMAGNGKLKLGEGLVLLTSCVAAVRFVPWSAELAQAEAMVLAGTLILAVSLAGRDGIGAGAIIVCLVAGVVTPLEPMKATLFPLLIASVLALLRGPSPFSVAAVVGTAVLAGRWAWPMAALTLASGLLSELLEPVLDRPRQPATAAFGVVPIRALPLSSGALAALAFSPESASWFFRAAHPARFGAVFLAAGALVLRPALGALYLIAALAMVLAGDYRTVGHRPDRDDEAPPIPLAAVAFSVAMLSLAGFSGAVVSRFPLPLPLAGIVGVAVVAVAAMPARRFPAIAAAASAIAFVTVVALMSCERVGVPMEAGAVLEAGQTHEVELSAGTRSVLVELSGGNLAGLEPGTHAGTLEAIDGAGRVVGRDVVIGDLADWGLGRPGHYFSARNDWPRSTQARVAEYGHRAFLGGSGTVKLTMPGMKRIRITAAPSLPVRGRLNVESVSVVSR